MGKTLQKIGVAIAAFGLIVSFASAVLIQASAVGNELVLGGLHSAGKVLMFVGLMWFLVVRVLGRLVLKLDQKHKLRAISTTINARDGALRVTLAGAVVAAFSALWLWPLKLVFEETAIAWAPMALLHAFGLVMFCAGGIVYIIAIAVKALAARPGATRRSNIVDPSRAPFDPSIGPRTDSPSV